MPFSGSGSFTPYTPGNPVVNGTTIDATAFNNTITDIASGLSNAVTRDGQSPPTANIPMGNFRHTGVANAVNRNDYAALGQVQDSTAQWLTSVAGTDTITASLAPAITAYAAGQSFRFVASGTNTGAVTININGLGAQNVTKNGATALAAGDIASGQIYTLTYDGTRFQISGLPGQSLTDSLRIDVASAGTVNLSSLAPNTRNIRITGTTTITGFTVASGLLYFVTFNGALTLTNNANIVTNTGANIITAAGDSCVIRATAANTVEVISYEKASAILANCIQPITASVGSNALTVTLNPTSLDFRSATLTSGAVVTRNVPTAISMTVSSGSTLGTVNNVQSDIVVLAIDNAGTVELAVVNIAGGVDLSETGVISTTAEGGAGAADSANVIYSTTARSNVPYRVVGIVRSTQTTAGTWASAPTLVQGAGAIGVTNLLTARLGASVATTSGTSIDFTGIPSWAKRITLMVNGVSFNASGQLRIQIGPSTTPETSGYAGQAQVFTGGAVGGNALSAGFDCEGSSASLTASTIRHGTLVLTLVSGSTWAASGVFGHSGTTTGGLVGGTKTITGSLGVVRVTTSGGSTFTAGSVNILYE